MIKEGDYVIAKTDTFLRLVQVCKDRPLFLGKRKVFIGAAIGYPYGSFFEIKGNGSLCVKKSTVPTELSLSTSSSSLKDNRSLVNSNDSQKLTTNDIESFKSEGVPGEEIVKIIVENSKSFEEKSAYSQEKYLKKKQLKYMSVMQVLEPNTRLLVETFYCYSPQKICNLRMDSLSQMLTFCNVMSGSKFIVVDTVLGLLTAAVLERIGSDGLVIQMLMSSSPPSIFRHAVDALNFTPKLLQELLLSGDYQKTMDLFQSEDLSDSLNEERNELPVTEMGDNSELQPPSSKQNDEKYKAKLMILNKIKGILLKKDMDGLLVASKHHPTCTLQLLDYLAFSRPFAIFSMYQEPLVDCYSLLKARGDIILLNISETWLRKYQVLPERTHPEYGMSANGGYLLTGIRVEKKT